MPNHEAIQYMNKELQPEQCGRVYAAKTARWEEVDKEIVQWDKQRNLRPELIYRKYLYREEDKAARSKTDSISSHARKLWESLQEIESECLEPNWDGYGAVPISSDALKEIRKLITLLPRDLLVPDLVPEPTGGIGLEWRVSDEVVLVLSVEGKNRISYSAILGKEANRFGSEEFNTTIPPFLQREFFPRIKPKA